MKRLILGVVVAAALIGLVYGKRTRSASESGPQGVSAADPMPELRRQAPGRKMETDTRKAEGSAMVRNSVRTTDEPEQVGAAKPTNITQSVPEMIQTLLSPQTTLSEKHAIRKKLKESGRLDEAISELEARAANDSQVPDYPVELGQAYLMKCGTTQDIREQAIFGMKADQMLETALNLDPSNWEARFTKTVGMSYWPAQLNKGPEVIDQFKTLIEQQEAQAPRPEFAQTYLRLGEQYKKSGFAENANQVWQRGASYFPDNGELKAKLPSPR